MMGEEERGQGGGEMGEKHDRLNMNHHEIMSLQAFLFWQDRVCSVS